MGRQSTMENKTPYQVKREEKKWSREYAARELVTITEDRLYRIEHGKPAYPYEIVEMAEAYGAPELCSYYCAQRCKIGERLSKKEIDPSDFSTAIIKTMAALSELNKQRDRLIEIAADSIIDEEELSDFNAICDALEKISMQAEALRMWMQRQQKGK